jgi:hypothetical protein
VEALEDRTVPGFLAPVTSPGGGDMLTLADVNHDHFADAVVISGAKSVSVSLGNGDGTFDTPVKLGGAGGKLYWVGVRDRNGDGNPDVEALGSSNLKYHSNPGGWSYYEGTLYSNVWLGNGDGTFGSPSTGSMHTNFFPEGGGIIYNHTSATGDFNNDGISDTAFIPYSQDGGAVVGVLLGNGDGTYQPAQIYAAGPNPGLIAVGDVNGDGRTDLVVVNSLGSNNMTFSALINDGSW